MNVTGETLAADYSDDGITCPCCGRDMWRACYGTHRAACGVRVPLWAEIAVSRAHLASNPWIGDPPPRFAPTPTSGEAVDFFALLGIA